MIKEKMMKKLLILMLVLGLTASANAVIITFDAPAEPVCTTYDRDVLAGAVVTINITSDTSSILSYAVSITETTTSAAGDLTASAGAAFHANYNFNVSTGILRNAMTNFGAGTPRYMLIDRATANQNPSNPVAAGLVLYSFEVLIPADAVFCDTFTITAALGQPTVSPPGQPPYGHAFDAGAIATTNALTLHVIPEPMTIALLGLGGLLLRRRK